MNEFCFRCTNEFAFGTEKLGEAADCSLNWSLQTIFSAYCTILIDPDFKRVLFMVIIESAPVRT